MAYRTKYYNIIWKDYLSKVFDFIGLAVDSSSGCSRIKWLGCDFTKDNKPVPAYFITKKYDREKKIDINKINVLIKNQDEFFNFKANKDIYEYFNPIIKHKQMLKLLLMMAPVIYERYCLTESDDLKDLVDLIVSDDVSYSQEEVVNHVNIKQYPSVPGLDGEMVYSFGMELIRDNGETCLFKTESKNKSVAILMLMIKTIELIDGEGIEMDEQYFHDTKVTIEELFEEYAKERERNYKDLKNVTIEKEITDFSQNPESEDDLELIDDLVDDLISPNTSSEGKLIEENTDSTGTINISNAFQGFIPIMPKESDDDLSMNLAFI